MMDRQGTPPDAAELRARAEDRLEERSARSQAGRPAEDVPRLLHELQVHQIELEMQNEELQAARVELEEGLQRQTDLYDFAPMGYLTLDSGGGIRKVNLAGARLLGLERARLVGAHFGPFVSAECRTTFNALLEKALASESKQVCEVALHPKAGPALWVHLEAVVSNDGRHECRVVLIDRTERRRLEETLRFRASLLDYAGDHSLLELLQETLDMVGVLTDSPIGFYHFVEPDQNTVSLQAWSRRTVSEFCSAQGFGSHHPIDQAGVWVDCVHQRRPVIHNDYASLPHRKGLPAGHVAITRDLVVPVMRSNRIVAILGVGNKASDYSEGDVRIVSSLADVAWTIIERKRAEQALRQSEQRFRRLFQSMDEGFALCEMIHDEAGRPVDFRYLEVNAAFSRLTGLPAQGLVGRTVKEVIPGIESSWIEAYDRVVQTGTPERIENRVERLGKRLDVHAWRAEDGRFAVVFSDVTEKRQNEEDLRIAQRMESVGRLAGGIAHDFNNLLTVIINHADFAMDGAKDGDPLRADLTEIRKAADRAASLTRQLLAFGRKQVLKPQVSDLNKIVGGMEGMLRRLLGEDIEFSIGLALDLGRVMVDPGQVDQVVMNLAVNARDAMPEGGRLTIETANIEVDEAYARQHMVAQPGAYVMLSVTDTGCGMDDRTRARLFEPFFSTKRTGKGTGLGLATVYGIVKQSGGSIWVQSQPGQGSTFKVYLPRHLSMTETVERVPEIVVRASGSETILLVEDEAAVRNLAGRILSQAGYTVLTAANGSEALLICGRQQEAVHLLLTDVVMPHMNGKALADRLVKLYPTLRVLYMSGYTNDVIVHHGVLDPGTHFIGKPFSPADLTRIVRQVLDGEPTSAHPGNESGRPSLSRRSS